MFLNTINRALFIGAHPDDIELACLGTILKMKENANCEINYITFSKGGKKTPFAIREKEQTTINNQVGINDISAFDLPDTQLTAHVTEMITHIESAVNSFNPDIVFTNSNLDHHQDHVAVYMASIAALRNYRGTVLLYPSCSYVYRREYNFFVDITEQFASKLELLQTFASQRNNWYFSTDYLQSIALQLGAKFGTKYAEGFQLYSSLN